MAKNKFSDNPIPDYNADWGRDEADADKRPYSGQHIQNFIRNELQTKINQTALFGEDSSKRSLVTNLIKEGTNLKITSIDSGGNESTTTLDISKEDKNERSVIVALSAENSAINVGGNNKIYYGFDVKQGNSFVTEAVGNVTIKMSIVGNPNPFYIKTIPNVAVNSTSGTPAFNVDITDILSKNITKNAKINVSVQVSHSYVYQDQETRVATGYGSTSIQVIALSLETNVNIANTGMQQQYSIDYSLQGNGEKSIYLYINGDINHQQASTITGITNYSTNGVFVINANSLPSGVTNFQIVAESRSGNTIVKSKSYYIDLFKPSVDPVICFKVENPNGEILTGNSYNSPEFKVSKFSNFCFNYYVYSQNSKTIASTITTKEINGTTEISSQTLDQILGQSLYTYTKRIKTDNKVSITFKAGSTTRTISAIPDTEESTIQLDVPTKGLVLNLDADGRDNNESNPSVWNYKDIITIFNGVNFQNDGWIKEKDGSTALLLKDGATATINCNLFSALPNQTFVNQSGCTFEILFKCENPDITEDPIISCLWDVDSTTKAGLNITPNYVGVNTGEKSLYETDKKDENNNPIFNETLTKVGANYIPGKYYKFTFVMDPKAPKVGEKNGLCYGYLDGILSYIAPMPKTFVNTDNIPITIDSRHAQIYIKSIKYYEGTVFTKNQCVDSFISDQTSIENIQSLYNDNKILDSETNKVSPKTLAEQGKGVLIITGMQDGENIIDALNKSRNKSSYFGPVRLDYFAPKYGLDIKQDGTIEELGKDYNFCHTACSIRVQGTTSTSRPRKNWRIHFNKTGDGGSGKITPNMFCVGGTKYNTTDEDCVYKISENAVAVPLICLKTDYVDSSMTHNTGGAIVFNEITKNVETLRNPVQANEFTNGDNNINNIKTRVAIEGYPIDVFTATKFNGTTDDDKMAYQETPDPSLYEKLKYIGQYNFNNDKSKSGAVFGFDGAYKYDIVESDNTYDITQYPQPDSESKYQPVCIEFTDNYKKLDLFQVQFNADGTINDENTYGEFSQGFEVRAPDKVTDKILANGLNPDKISAPYKYIPYQIKRLFNFVGECAKQALNDKSKKNIPELDLTNPQCLNNLSSQQLDNLDWTSSNFKNNAEHYFNLDSVCAWYIWTDYMLAVDQRAKNMMMYTMDGKHWMFQYYDGDTMLGERNDCYLAYNYLTDEKTIDYSIQQYAFQGHDSWLWYLIRANFSNRLNQVARKMRESKLNPNYIKHIFNNQIVENWSERAYNYSQEYKYITPLTEDFSSTSIRTDYVNTAQGSRQSHRDYIIDNRFNLLDSYYCTGNWEQNSFTFVSTDQFSGTGDDDSRKNIIEIKTDIPYYFGWQTTGQQGIIKQRKKAEPNNNYTITLEIFGNGVSTPASILGASNIKEITFKQGAWVGETDNAYSKVSLKSVEKIIARHNTDGTGITGSGNLDFSGCSKLKELDLSGVKFGKINIRNLPKLTTLNLIGTNIDNINLLDSQMIQNLKIESPNTLYLSNSPNLIYNGTEADTLVINDSSKLQYLYIDNCSQVDKNKLLEKFRKSTPGGSKYLRFTGIDEEVEDLNTFIQKFEKDANGRKIYGLNPLGETTNLGVQLEGEIRLTKYHDPAYIKQVENTYGSLLKICNLQYTIIETDETGYIDESKGAYNEGTTILSITGSTTNLENNTGAKSRVAGSYSTTKYEHSGHISNILSNCHRYLGKITTAGTNINDLSSPEKDKYVLEGNKKEGKYFGGILDDGIMSVCQLDDKNSTLYKDGSVANLSGLKQNNIFEGEVYTKIPRFWYKGINYNPIIQKEISNGVITYVRPSSNNKKSLRYTCYSTESEAPSRSPRIKEITKEEWILHKPTSTLLVKENSSTVQDRIISGTLIDSDTNIYKVDVEGYKKIKFPVCQDKTRCCLFTGQDGETILTSPSTNSYTNYGEIIVDEDEWLYTGMPAIVTIPPGAKWFYFPVRKYIYKNHEGNNVNNALREAPTADHCSIILHDGKGFDTGFDMTEYNAKEWIADMEPDWVESKEMLIACGECANSSSGKLYTGFTDVSSVGGMTQISFKDNARLRKLQLVDYEASKILANLFVAKYGRRSSQAQLGYGSNDYTRGQGRSRYYGMQDTVSKNLAADQKAWIKEPNGNYKDIGSPVFLGIENIHGNKIEWLERAYYRNDSPEDVGKLIITDYRKERKIYRQKVNGMVKSVVHGKYCDIINCVLTVGNDVNYYSDYQSSDLDPRNSWNDVRGLGRSGIYAGSHGGVFYLGGGNWVSFSSISWGSRLMFRGKIEEITDVNEFKNLTSVSIPND